MLTPKVSTIFRSDNYQTAIRIFSFINLGKVSLQKDDEGNYAIYTLCPPTKLRYPQGWQYKDGFFCRNPLGSQDEEAIFLLLSGQFWGNIV